jgi:hypothetical protein
MNFVEDHPRNIPAKLGSNRPSGFGEEAWNVKSLQTTDDGCQVMAIVHMDLTFDPGEQCDHGLDHWTTTSSNGVMAWICGHPNLLTFECLDSSLSLYFLVYDFLCVFFYLCINFWSFIYSLGSVSSLVSEKKIFEISTNHSILLALAAMLNIRLEQKTVIL